MTPKQEKAFWQIHKKLPRQAPGSDATTRKLLRLADLPKTATDALDIGCGPGRSAFVLADNGLRITAIDTSETLLEELRASLAQKGYEDTITANNVSMFEIPCSDSSFDLVWAEGAAYIATWDNAIKDWQRLLRPGGKIVITECCWLTNTPSEATRQFWDEGYPTMLNVDQATDHAKKFGLAMEATYTLPDRDWWDEYYLLIEKRLEENRDSNDSVLQEVMAAERAEIDLRKKYASEYGYVGFILSKQEM